MTPNQIFIVGVIVAVAVAAVWLVINIHCPGQRSDD